MGWWDDGLGWDDGMRGWDLRCLCYYGSQVSQRTHSYRQISLIQHSGYYLHIFCKGVWWKTTKRWNHLKNPEVFRNVLFFCGCNSLAFACQRPPPPEESLKTLAPTGDLIVALMRLDPLWVGCLDLGATPLPLPRVWWRFNRKGGLWQSKIWMFPKIVVPPNHPF